MLSDKIKFPSLYWKKISSMLELFSYLSILQSCGLVSSLSLFSQSEADQNTYQSGIKDATTLFMGNLSTESNLYELGQEQEYP